jgi:trehalose/maltose transport system permease protein
MLAILALIAGWPLARTIYFSLTNANLSDIQAAKFIGFDNYLAYYGGMFGRVVSTSCVCQ